MWGRNLCIQHEQVPALDDKGSKSKAISIQTRFFLPSQWMVALQHESLGAEWEQCFGCESKLKEFWVAQKPDDPKWKNHPAMAKKDYQTKAIPVVLHGDGASFQKRDSLMTVSFQGLLREGQTLETTLLLSCFPKNSTCKSAGGTWDTIWAWLVWDFNQLAHNKYASHDPWGQPLEEDMASKVGQPILTSNFFVVVVGTLGDNDYLQLDLKIPHWANQLPKRCCHLCDGDKVSNNWFNFKDTAKWWASTPKSPASDHIINKIVGWTPFHFHLDWLHCVDLGTTSHCLANLFFHVVYTELKHKSRGVACQELAAVLIPESAKCGHGSSISSFELKHFVADAGRPHKDYPVLHGLKAAEVRGLVEPAYLVAQQYSNGSNFWKHMLRLLAAQCHMYKLLYNSSIVLSDEEYNAFSKACKVFLQEYTFLGQQALQNHILMWSVVPKHHYLAHLSQTAKWLNPRWTWCYGGEDMVGKISGLAHACTSGTSSIEIQSKVMDKYRLAKHISWHAN